MDYSIISKNRGKIMSLSIISIIIFHYFEDVNIYKNASILLLKCSRIFSYFIGSIGVDIFLIVSALGLYYSFTKNNNIKDFYVKRIKRVFIPYLIIGGVYWIIFDFVINKYTISKFFLDYFWITFIIEKNTTFWYIFAIIILYISFPFLYKFLKKGNIYLKTLLLVFLNIVINLLLHLFCRNLYNNIEIFLTRIPNFIYGIYLASKVYNNDKITKKNIYISLIFIIAVVIIKIATIIISTKIFYLISRYLNLIFAINSVLLMSIILEKINVKFINIPLEKISKYTLELYIFHVAYREIFNYYNLYTSLFKYEIIMLILAISSSIMFNKTYTYLIKKIDERNKIV